MPGPRDKNTIRARAEALTAQGTSLFFIGRYSDALALLEQAIALDAGVARAHSGKSMALAQLGRPAEGLAAAEEAIRRDPEFVVAYTARALCLSRLGRHAEAGEAYARAEELAPQDARVLYNIACHWAERGDEAKCRDYLVRAFQYVESDVVEHSRDDPDLARYVNTEWFRELLAAAKRKRYTRRQENSR